MKIRLIKDSDHPWVEKRYQEQGFLRSNFAKDILVIAEVDGKKAGVGRLVPIDESTFELGGIFVEELFRGQGIAKAVIDHLLAKADGKTVYTIPLNHQVELYKSIGFEKADEQKSPRDVVDKYHWCQKRHEFKVGLLKKTG